MDRTAPGEGRGSGSEGMTKREDTYEKAYQLLQNAADWLTDLNGVDDPLVRACGSIQELITERVFREGKA